MFEASRLQIGDHARAIFGRRRAHRCAKSASGGYSTGPIGSDQCRLVSGVEILEIHRLWNPPCDEEAYDAYAGKGLLHDGQRGAVMRAGR